MKDMKKILALLIAGAMIFGIVACDSSSKKSKDRDDKKTEEEEDEDEDETEEDETESEQTETEAAKETDEIKETDVTDETDETTPETDETGSGTIESRDINDVNDNDLLNKLKDISGAQVVPLSELSSYADDYTKLVDGVIFYAEGEAVKTSWDGLDNSLAGSGVEIDDEDIWNKDSIEYVVDYMKAYTNDMSMYTETFVVQHYKDADIAKKSFDNLAVSLKDSGIDVSIANSDEYYNGDDMGYLIINIDLEMYLGILLGESGEIDPAMLDQYKQIIGDLQMAVGFYRVDKDVICMLYMNNDGTNFVSEPLLTYFNIKNPLDVKNSDAFMMAFFELAG